jgi:hypothetical protein
MRPGSSDSNEAPVGIFSVCVLRAFQDRTPVNLFFRQVSLGGLLVPSRPPVRMMATKSSFLPPSKPGQARVSGNPGAVHLKREPRIPDTQTHA